MQCPKSGTEHVNNNMFCYPTTTLRDEFQETRIGRHVLVRLVKSQVLNVTTTIMYLPKCILMMALVSQNTTFIIFIGTITL